MCTKRVVLVGQGGATLEPTSNMVAQPQAGRGRVAQRGFDYRLGACVCYNGQRGGNAGLHQIP